MEINLTREQLLLQCEWKQAQNPVEHVMPSFDALGEQWSWDPEEMGNSHFRDRFHFWCSLDSRATFALYSSEGFFGPGGMVFAGGMQIESEAFEPADDQPEDDGLHISGYCWEQSGVTHLLSNREDNQSWCDTDDWLFEPFFFSDFMPDGSMIPECPPGYCRSWERDEDGQMMPGCRPLPKLDLDESLLQIGFRRPRRPGSEESQLERMFEES